jgi:hypothetical protein
MQTGHKQAVIELPGKQAVHSILQFTRFCITKTGELEKVKILGAETISTFPQVL